MLELCIYQLGKNITNNPIKISDDEQAEEFGLKNKEAFFLE